VDSSWLSEKLKALGHKTTPQRRAVFEVLCQRKGTPMSPDEIHRACLENGHRLGLTTVYRSLELFRDAGLVLEVHLHEPAQYYELDDGAHHHHLVCVGCGAVEKFETRVVEEMAERIREQHHFLVRSHCLSIFGYCTSCASEAG